MKFNIDACHPIFKRILKFNLPLSEKNTLVKELKDLGYDDIQIETIYDEWDEKPVN